MTDEVAQPALAPARRGRGRSMSRRTRIGVGLIVVLCAATLWEAASTDFASNDADGSTVTTAPGTTAGPPTTKVGGRKLEDSFDRDQANTSLGRALSGQPWRSVAGKWGTVQGAAYIDEVTSGIPGRSLAVTALDAADGVISADVSGNSVCGLVVRFVDRDNFITLKRVPAFHVWNLEEVVDGKLARLGYFAEPAVEPVRIVIGYRGTSITASVGGQTHPVVVSSIDPNAKEVGMLGEGPASGDCRWDELVAVEIDR